MLVLLGFLWLHPASAAEPSRLHYYATWAGLPAAHIYLRLDDGRPDFRSGIEIATVGLPRLLSHFQARAEADGALQRDATAIPAQYDAHYRLRRRHKQISIRYRDLDEGRLAEKGPGDTGEHPLLADKLRRDVLDPLSCLVEIRDLIRSGKLKGGGSFHIPVYDGKRRFDVDGKRLPPSDPPAGLTGRLLKLSLLLRPIAGFRVDEREDEDIDQSPREVTLWFSDDDRLIPLRMTVSIAYLPAVVNLVGECSPQAPCQIVTP